MEFFRIVQRAIGVDRLQEALTLETLPRICQSIDNVMRDEGNEGEIYCLWGQFRIHRELVKGGVRFTLPTCPNALQWTITYGFHPAPAGVTVHATINRVEHEPEFVESIEMFLDDWVNGLTGLAHD